MDQLRVTASCLAGLLAAAHLGMFILMLQLLNQQSSLVNDLNLIGR
jgi:hypothetical protein